MTTIDNRQLSTLLAKLRSNGRQSVAAGEFAQQLGLSVRHERVLIQHLVNAGDLVRVERGRFLIRPQNLRNSEWSPNESLALAALITDAGGQYQLCGPNAFQRYGWDDQVPNRIFAYNTKISGERLVGTVAMTLIKVDVTRLGETEVAQTSDGLEMIWPTRARALLDGVYDWSRFNSLPRCYGWIRQELERDDAFAADLVDVTLQFANQGTLRRIGKLLELADVSAGLIRKLERRLSQSTSFIPWIPVYPKRGSIDRRWGVVFNDGT